MPYLVDRERALRIEDVVAELSVRHRRVRSRATLRDNSLYHTLTRTQTIVRRSNEGVRGQGARWRTHP